MELAVGLIVSAAAFGMLGTLAALWPNPLFIRMTPTSGFEITLLAVQSILLGAYLGIRRATCAVPKATLGSVLGFLGIACPVCNKILLFVFGSGFLLTYFEPIRLYVAVAGVLLTLLALWQKLKGEATLYPAKP
jgi:hypothetical protein